jgi:hypothetical protein
MNSKILFVAIAIVTAFDMTAVVGLATVTPVLGQDNMTNGRRQYDYGRLIANFYFYF